MLYFILYVELFYFFNVPEIAKELLYMILNLTGLLQIQFLE